MYNFWLKLKFLWCAYLSNYFYKDHSIPPATGNVILNEDFSNNKYHYDWELPSWDEQSWTDWTGGAVIYLDSQITFKNSTLILTTDKCVPQKPKYPKIMSGEITSTKFFNHSLGCFTEVCMIPSQIGWSCPWWWQSDVPTHRVSGSTGYEIDFGEFECDTPNAFTISIHSWGTDGRTNKIIGTARFQAAKDLTKNYHVFGCDWQKTYINFYLDNKKIYQYTGEIPNSNCFLIVSQGYKIGDLPVSAYVKQIRVQE